METGIRISLYPLLAVVCLLHTGARSSNDCAVSNFDAIYVNGTDLSGTVLLRTPPSDTVYWTVSGKEKRDKTLLAGYLGFRNGSDGHYELFLTKTLDTEELVPVLKKEIDAIKLQLTCMSRKPPTEVSGTEFTIRASWDIVVHLPRVIPNPSSHMSRDASSHGKSPPRDLSSLGNSSGKGTFSPGNFSKRDSSSQKNSSTKDSLSKGIFWERDSPVKGNPSRRYFSSHIKGTPSRRDRSSHVKGTPSRRDLSSHVKGNLSRRDFFSHIKGNPSRRDLSSQGKSSQSNSSHANSSSKEESSESNYSSNANSSSNKQMNSSLPGAIQKKTKDDSETIWIASGSVGFVVGLSCMLLLLTCHKMSNHFRGKASRPESQPKIVDVVQEAQRGSEDQPHIYPSASTHYSQQTVRSGRQSIFRYGSQSTFRSGSQTPVSPHSQTPVSPDSQTPVSPDSQTPVSPDSQTTGSPHSQTTVSPDNQPTVTPGNHPKNAPLEDVLEVSSATAIIIRGGSSDSKGTNLLSKRSSHSVQFKKKAK